MNIGSLEMGSLDLNQIVLLENFKVRFFPCYLLILHKYFCGQALQEPLPLLKTKIEYCKYWEM